MTLLIVIAGSLMADFVGTVLGFGAATVFMPFALLVFDFRTALLVVAVSHLMSGICRVLFFRGRIDLRLVLAFGIPGVIGSIVGALVTVSVPERLLLSLLGAFLIVFVAAAFLKFTPKLPATGKTAVAGGALYGVVAGLIGTAGAIRGAFLFAFGLPKEVYIATSAAIAIAVDAVRVPIYIFGGGVEDGFWHIFPFLALTAVIGTWLGKRFVHRLPVKQFRSVVLTGLLIFGLKFLYDGLISRVS